MNLILFREDEPLGALPISDFRAKHILNIIKSSIGDTLDMGVVNSKKGKMTITEISSSHINFSYNLDTESPNLYPITLIIGTPRPPVAKRLLKDLSTAGVKKIIMCATDLGEKTYLTSKLWKDNNFMDYIYDGAAQAESTIIPKVSRFFSLKKALESIPENYNKLAMDNIDPDLNISEYERNNSETVVCIGGERGFSDRERVMLREYGYSIFSLGNRILRTESACHRVLGSLLTTL